MSLKLLVTKMKNSREDFNN